MDSDNDNDEPFFLYKGQSKEDIPRNVTHAKVDPSVKVIGEKAFYECNQLRSVELCEGLERIEFRAFAECESLTSIVIPSTVEEIAEDAFCGCWQLINVELNEGLWGIDQWAFAGTRLQQIRIPSTVNYIAKDAFEDYDSLEAIEFCDEIEQFVNEASLHWWNHGVSKASLRTYSFLVQYNIPSRLSKIKVRVWKKNIHNMLRHMPEELQDNDNEDDSDDDNYLSDDDEEYKEYFDSIESRLSNYEQLCDDVVPILELACWKAKMTDNLNGNVIITHDMRVSSCHKDDALSMSGIIIPNVLPFLLDD